MRPRPILLGPWLLAGAVLLAPLTLNAQDKKGPPDKVADGQKLKIDAQLTVNDAFDAVRQGCRCKIHTVKFVAGRTYTIDMISNQLDSYLRLIDPKGNQVAEDDDSGGFPHARIVYKATVGGDYKIVATTFANGAVGQYTVTCVGDGAVELVNVTDSLETRARNIGRSPPEERKKIVAEFGKQLADKKGKLTIEDVRLAMNVAQALEDGGSRDLAQDAYETFGKVVTGAEDKELAERGKPFQGAARRLTLPGKELIVKGTTVDGKAFDWKTYRGKIVLVNFWASWYRPCREELAGLKKLYDTYHARGFEIVGISVDHNRNELVRFLENEKLPWVCLHEKAGDTSADSMSSYYGVFSIPLPILVDREGRVVSVSARGEELGRLLEKHLGTSEPKGGAK